VLTLPVMPVAAGATPAQVRTIGVGTTPRGVALAIAPNAVAPAGQEQALPLPVTPQPAATGSPQARVTEALHSSPVMFIQNVGQFADDARFQVRGADKTIWLAEDAIWVTVVEEPHPTPGPSGHPSPLSATERGEGPGVRGEVRGVNLKLSFPGSNPHPSIEPFNRLETVISYFIGNDPAKWHVAVPVWGGVRYVDLYPGIDLELTGENGRVVPRLVVRPGADLSAVRLRVEGADAVALTPSSVSGESRRGLLLRTAVSEFTLPLFQVEGGNTNLAMVQQVDGLAFEVSRPFTAGNEAVSALLFVVHPQQAISLLYSGFLGGSGRDGGSGITLDSSGNTYVTGWTNSSAFPTTPGAFDTTYGGGTCSIGSNTYPCYDAFVAKVNPAGTALLYAGFLGGSGDDYGFSIVVDSSGNTYVTGYTSSSDFPVIVGPDTRFNGSWDAFVAKVNPAGTALLYSGFLGGSNSDYGYSIAVDVSGNTYVTGETWSSDFPVVVGRT